MIIFVHSSYLCFLLSSVTNTTAYTTSENHFALNNFLHLIEKSTNVQDYCAEVLDLTACLRKARDVVAGRHYASSSL